MKVWLDPRTVLYGLLALLYLMMLIVIEPQDPAVFFLWLLSVAVLIVRLRFRLDTQWLLVDVLIYLALLLVEVRVVYLILPSLVLWMASGKLWAISLYMLIWVGLFRAIDATLFLGVMGGVGGGLLFVWQRDGARLRQDSDRLRDKVYRLEQERTRILQEQATLSRVSQLAERDRIAQALHDDLGHQLTGALMGLRAYQTAHPEAEKDTSFSALRQRLEGAVNSLRDTVQSTQPEESIGFEQFKVLLDTFDAVPLNYEQHGNLALLDMPHWHVLTSVLQEALTNALKHANATHIDVELTVTGQIVRLTLTNDGLEKRDTKHGQGLIYMRRRLEALGGTLNIQQARSFTLRAIVPLNLEG